MLGSCIRSPSPQHEEEGRRILVNEEEMRGLLDRCEAKKGKNGQHTSSVMRRCRTWKTSLGKKELKKVEEALPRLKECQLKKNVEIVQGENRIRCATASTPMFRWI